MAVEYSRFQLGRDYSPLTQALQKGSDQFIQQLQFNQSLKQKQAEADALAQSQLARGQAKGILSDRSAYYSLKNPKVTYRLVNVTDVNSDNPTGKTVYYGSDNSISTTPPEGGLGRFNESEFSARGKITAETDPDNVEKLVNTAKKLAFARIAGESDAAYAERFKAAATAGAVSGAMEGAKQEERVASAKEMESETGEGKIESKIVDQYLIPATKGYEEKASAAQVQDLLANVPQGRINELLGVIGEFVPGKNTFGEDEIQALRSFAIEVAGEDMRLNPGTQTQPDFLASLGKAIQQKNTRGANKLIQERRLQNADYNIKLYKDLRKWKADGNSALDYEPISFEEFMGKKEPSAQTKTNSPIQNVWHKELSIDELKAMAGEK